MSDGDSNDTDSDRAVKCGCENCDCVGMRIPDSSGKYAFDDIGTATICVEESGGVVIHFPGVENV